MKKILTIVLLAVSSLAHADCEHQRSMIERQERRIETWAKNDPALVKVMTQHLDDSKAALAQCLTTQAQYKAEDEARAKLYAAKMAKLPAPSIGQRKQDTNWGEPEHVSTTTTAQGTVEIQLFGSGYSLLYVNNRITAITRGR